MQDRYAGDVGDFVKFGLLNHLAKSAPGQFRLGINWYLAPGDEGRGADGKHISYLEPKNRIGRKLARLHPELYSKLAAVVSPERRSVAELESAELLPGAPVYFGERLHRSMSPVDRGAWHARALNELEPAPRLRRPG